MICRESFQEQRNTVHTKCLRDRHKRPLNFARRKSLVQVGKALCSKEGTYSGVRDYTKSFKNLSSQGEKEGEPTARGEKSGRGSSVLSKSLRKLKERVKARAYSSEGRRETE